MLLARSKALSQPLITEKSANGSTGLRYEFLFSGAAQGGAISAAISRALRIEARPVPANRKVSAPAGAAATGPGDHRLRLAYPIPAQCEVNPAAAGGLNFFRLEAGAARGLFFFPTEPRIGGVDWSAFPVRLAAQKRAGSPCLVEPGWRAPPVSPCPRPS